MPRAFTDPERQRIRALLLRAASESMRQGGLRRAPIESLARAAGISKGAFYQFFSSKEELAIALLQEGEAEARATLTAAAGQPTDPLAAVLNALFELPGRHPALAGLIDPEEVAWLTRALPPELLAAARADDDAFFLGLFAGLRDQGHLRPDAEDLALCGLAGAALALVQQRALIGEDRFDAVRALIVAGLLARLRPSAEAAAPKGL